MKYITTPRRSDEGVYSYRERCIWERLQYIAERLGLNTENQSQQELISIIVEEIVERLLQ